ncbi:hypothetical protein CKAH01_15552 [Colletotrichum kahawae]|uniref:Single-strand DNA deaminase toxin A-like C-terminal domain-containing protein n=1 Tax=Colletotrichum kahawae TaxID=34407 RepID=A0AAD9YIH6_COLKA|nr:hypothetical protein CKAH01_15552 [Colletotrichum kahawae]
MFVCGTADPTAYFGELGEEQPKPRKITFRNRKKWTNAKEQVHYSESMTGLPGGYSVERFIVVLDDYDSYSSSREGNEKPESKIQITGNTALHYAACKKSDAMVRLLLQKGAKPNVINAAARSPLMEAALWGRLRNIELLLEYGADTGTYCIRNGQRLRVVDFAMPLEENIAERESLAGGSTERIRLRGIATELQMFVETVAVLYRGGRFPGVAAMSGWVHGEKFNIQVSGKDWTQEVHDLCKKIGFSLRPHDRDQGSRGRYYACHAEKQPVPYFISKHLRENVEDVIASENLRLDDADDHAERGQNGWHHRERLPALEHIEPPVTLLDYATPGVRPHQIPRSAPERMVFDAQKRACETPVARLFMAEQRCRLIQQASWSLAFLSGSLFLHG